MQTNEQNGIQRNKATAVEKKKITKNCEFDKKNETQMQTYAENEVMQ